MGVLKWWNDRSTFMHREREKEKLTPNEEILLYLETLKPNTQRSYARIYKDWYNFCILQNVKITEITLLHIALFFKKRKAKNLAGRTILSEYGALRGIYRFLQFQGHIQVNNFESFDPKVTKTTNEKRPTQMIEYANINKILTMADNSFEGLRDKAMFSLFFGGAMRISEVSSLRLEDIKITLQGAVLAILRNTKNGETKEQIIIDEFSENIKNYINELKVKNYKNIPLFFAERNKGLKKLSETWIKRRFKSYCKELKIKASTHSARATTITGMVESGLNHKEIAEFSRHKSVLMVEEYDKRRIKAIENKCRKFKFSSCKDDEDPI